MGFLLNWVNLLQPGLRWEQLANRSKPSKVGTELLPVSNKVVTVDVKDQWWVVTTIQPTFYGARG